MAAIEPPYLWPAKGRGGRQYWFYRRGGQLEPISSAEGQRLWPGDPGFFEAYERIHASFEKPAVAGPVPGTLAYLVDDYRAHSADYKKLTRGSRRVYDRHLDYFKDVHGHRSVAKLTREVV